MSGRCPCTRRAILYLCALSSSCAPGPSDPTAPMPRVALACKPRRPDRHPILATPPPRRQAVAATDGLLLAITDRDAKALGTAFRLPAYRHRRVASCACNAQPDPTPPAREAWLAAGHLFGFSALSFCTGDMTSFRNGQAGSRPHAEFHPGHICHGVDGQDPSQAQCILGHCIPADILISLEWGIPYRNEGRHRIE